MEISGRTILISGGSSGLGAACVRRLVGHGANVVIADLSEAGRSLAESLGPRVAFAPTDVTSEADVRRAVALAEQQFGGLHGAITCAGILQAERVVGRDGAASLEAFQRVINVNLVGTFNVVRLAAEAIAKQSPGPDGERGVIVMTSSVAAEEGQIGQAAYSASKGGIASMTLPLARDLARVGIRVISIAPGVFETPMMQTAPEAVRKSLAEQIPFPPRLGHPDEFAALVEHAFENRMLNGTVMRIDGAMRMGPR